MSWIMVGVGGGISLASGVGNYFAGKGAADAQQNIASEQMRMAREILGMQQQDRNRALDLASASPQELAQINQQLVMSMQSLNSQLASISKDEELLHAVDPALKEAGMQAYGLLKGQEASALNPIRTERAKQRQQLEATLRDQVGSGYSTSTIGRQALNQFDDATAASLQQAQSNTINSFLGLSASVRPDISGKLGRAYGGAAQIGATGLSALQNVGARQVNAFNQSPVNYQGLMSTAGGQYVGQLAGAQAEQGLYTGIGQLGGNLLGMGLQSKMFGDQIAGQQQLLGTIFPRGSYGSGVAAPRPGLPAFGTGNANSSYQYNPITGAPMFGGGAAPGRFP